jgi:hypothetical protein
MNVPLIAISPGNSVRMARKGLALRCIVAAPQQQKSNYTQRWSMHHKTERDVSLAAWHERSGPEFPMSQLAAWLEKPFPPRIFPHLRSTDSQPFSSLVFDGANNDTSNNWQGGGRFSGIHLFGPNYV